MRLIGYCVRCRRIKRVTVNTATLGQAVPQGICADCEEERR